MDEGDNTIILSGGGHENLAALNVTYNPGYEFGGALVIKPDVIYVGEPDTLIAEIPVIDPSTDANSVRLVEVTPDGELEIAVLTDDGLNGDEIKSDRVFTVRTTITAQSCGCVKLRVIALSSGKIVRSEVFDVLVTTHVTLEEMHAILSLQAQKSAELKFALDSGYWPAGLQVILEEFLRNPMVSEVGISQGGKSVWVVYKCGVAGAVSAPHEEVKDVQHVIEAKTYKNVPGLPQASDQRRPRYGTSQLTASTLKASQPAGFPTVDSTTSRIESKKALLISARYWRWGGSDDLSQIEPILNQACLDVVHIKHMSQGCGDVEDFKRLGAYGIVCISSSGECYFNGISKHWATVFGWHTQCGQVVVDSNMAVTDSSTSLYEDDLKRGRLVIWNQSYAMTPAFFSYYTGVMPRSLLYASLCRSSCNHTLAKAFLELGAGAFLGYSDCVELSFCREVGATFFSELTNGTGTVADAFLPNQRETDSDPAEFRLFGSALLTLDVSGQELHDGGFESGNISQAWSVSGSARVLSVLGDFTPVEGSRMGMIWTGPGNSSTYGRIRQVVCVPEGATKLSFFWNFVSEEFIEWCGSTFVDYFSVRVVNTQTGISKTVFERYVDQLCDRVSQVPFSFDQGDVYATGWQEATVDLPPYAAGSKVILDFSVWDSGDDIYDTAVLLDAISIH